MRYYRTDLGISRQGVEGLTRGPGVGNISGLTWGLELTCGRVKPPTPNPVDRGNCTMHTTVQLNSLIL